jgi:hypothetical protein
MAKIKLVLSFDYELPLGGTKNYKKGLFEPTEQLLSLAHSLNVPISLFADICSAEFFKKWDEKNYFIPFVNQLHTVLKGGNEVQLHIHPHWITSKYENAEFVPSEDFMLGTFKKMPELYSIDKIIKNSANSLNDICSSAIPGYKCISYRAGGFNLEPNSDIIFNTLAENGIKIDSSIIKNYYLHTEFVTINYHGMPKQANWFINNGELRKPSNIGIFEIPIAAKPKTFITNFPDKMRRKMHKERAYNHEGKGYGIKLGGLTLKDKLLQSISPRMLTFDVHSHRVKDLISIIVYNLKKYNEEGTIYLSVLSHPKAMGSYHFSLMKGFVDAIKLIYKNKVEFTRYKDISDELNL